MKRKCKIVISEIGRLYRYTYISSENIILLPCDSMSQGFVYRY